MGQIAYYVITAIVLIIVFVLEYFAAAKLRELNEKIAREPNYLNEGDNRELCKTILYNSYVWGYFTFKELRKLKKSLGL